MTTRTFCASDMDFEKMAAAEKDFQAKMAADKGNKTVGHELKTDVTTIPVYWNVIYADGSFDGGNIPYVSYHISLYLCFWLNATCYPVTR